MKIKKRRFRYCKYVKRQDVVGQLAKKLSVVPCHDHVLISQEEMDILSRYILDYKDIETGGQLFGYWTYDGKPVVLFVLGPGPNAGHYNTFFMQDIEYLKERALFLKARFGLDHIGEWHSHHQLGLPCPSGHDANNISHNMCKLGYSKFLLCIGTCTEIESYIDAYMFYSDRSNYNRIPWEIKSIASPFRKIMSQVEINAFYSPKTELPNMGRLYLKDYLSKQNKINYAETYWLKQEGNAKILKAIIDALGELHQDKKCVPTINSDNEVHLELYCNDIIVEDVYFPKGFPVVSPRIYNSKCVLLSESMKWNFDGDILKSFVSFYKSIKISNYDER